MGEQHTKGGFQIGDHVEFADAKGQRIRGRVTAGGLGSSIRVVFQRGWTWASGFREPRSDYAWSFDRNGLMMGFELEVAIVHQARATGTKDPASEGGRDG